MDEPDAGMREMVWPKRAGLVIWDSAEEPRSIVGRMEIGSPMQVVAESGRYLRIKVPPDGAEGYVLGDAVASSPELAAAQAADELERATSAANREESGPPIDLGPQIASFPKRVAGTFLDNIVNLIPTVALSLFLFHVLLPDHYTRAQLDSTRPKVTATVILVILVYRWIANSYGGTLGKRAVGIRVVCARTHRAPGLRRGAIRTIASIGSGLVLGLGYLRAAWDDDGRTWHDQIAGTLVIDKRSQ